MLTREENELFTRVGPGTPMGDLLRQYWQPVFLSWEVETDGRPLRIRLMSESLVAFRDSSGKVGILANNCPHRGASLFFGRNEEEGLRCVYHGWKFDMSGRCLDMPNEPPESNFKDKVRASAYPCVERNGVVWAYLGPREEPPPPPDLPWATLPAGHCFISMRMQMCNWAQATEGGIDSSHISFLHSWLDADGRQVAPRGSGAADHLPDQVAADRHPHFEVLDTDCGMLIGARRNAEPGTYYWRITQFMMPFFTIVPGSLDPADNLSGHAWVPLDDQHTMTWSITWNETRPLREDEVAQMQSFPGGGIHYGRAGMKPETTEPGGKWIPALCADNDFGHDYELQRSKRFMGIEQFGTQDSAIQETMGTIFDRTREHLGTSDTGVIRYRRRLISAARALREQGTTPPAIDAPGLYQTRSASLILPKEVDWVEGSKDARVPVNARGSR